MLVSRDRKLYACGVHGVMGGSQLLASSLSGGVPKVIASTDLGTLFVAGWTTM